MKELCRNGAILAATIIGLIAPEARSLANGSPPQAIQSRVLIFADRVAYQYAIEEIYWRHRIWPKENPNPKPSLDEVMSRAQIEKKVEDYLRNSQLLADRRRPITPAELQAEMDRMAQHTKQPDVLRELFAALGNDPFVIAECLARPVLAERMAAQRVGGSSAPSLDDKFNREAIANSWPSAPGNIARGAADPPETDPMSIRTQLHTATYKLPEISAPLDCTDDTWTPTSLTNAPAARRWHTAVWTGSEMIVWGGIGSNGSNLNTGGRYNPSTDSWTATSTASAPAARNRHTAVWTGSEMIVWGGYIPGTGDSNTGGRYSPGTDSWTATNTTNAPDAREVPTAVWTGSEMIVWGGSGNSARLNTGGRYDPSADSWTATSLTNAPDARYGHTAVWTGSEMILWGGHADSGYLNTGGRYSPSTDSWTATNVVGAPAGRQNHMAVWTSSEMIVWGGDNFNNYFNTGGTYDPSTDSWTATSIIGAPAARDAETAVWTGSEMILWGGYDGNAWLNTGSRYNPSTDSWTATSLTNAPQARGVHTAVWTGSEMVVWGGTGSSGYLNTGGGYCAHPSGPIVQSAVSRKSHGGAGTFDVNLPLTGTPGIECRSAGATHDYTMVVTFSGNVTVTGNPQAQVTLGTGCVGSNGICTGNVNVSGHTVTVPLTNIANAQTINVRINGVNSAAANVPVTDFTIPMSILIADTNGNRTVNAADVAQTKSRIGQIVDATNFRSDVNANGSINAADVSIVKSAVGTGLP